MTSIHKIPVVILSGFLGSGKTTLLANWIRSPAFSGAQVIVNELGEVGLDHELVSNSGDGSLLLDSGCACCTVFESLTETLERLFWRRLHREIPAFSWVLVETTGIADPGAIVAKLNDHALIHERYEVSSVVTVVDATHAGNAAFDEFDRQLRAARAVVISKTDMASNEQVQVAARRVRTLTPAPLMHARNGELSIETLLDHLQTPPVGVRSQRPRREEHRHSHGFSTAFLPVPQGVQEWVFHHAIGRLLARHRDCVLRLKGFVRTAEYERLKLLQLGPSGKLVISDAPDNKDSDRQTGLTLISRQVLASSLTQELSGYLENPAMH